MHMMYIHSEPARNGENAGGVNQQPAQRRPEEQGQGDGEGNIIYLHV